MTTLRIIGLFTAAALAEIGGGWLVSRGRDHLRAALARVLGRRLWIAGGRAPNPPNVSETQVEEETMNRKLARVALRLLVAGGGATLVAGCAGAEPTAPEEPTAGVAAIDVDGIPVTVEDGHVETSCFGFDTDPDYEYEVARDAEGCFGDVNWPGGDALTGIYVRAQTGDQTLTDLVDLIGANGLAVLDSSTLSVDGADAYRVDFEDAYGLASTTVIVSLPEGKFVHGDAPLTQVFVSGKTYNEDLATLFWGIVESLDIHE